MLERRETGELTFERLHVVAGEDSGFPVEFSLPPVRLVLAEDGDDVPLLEAELVLVLARVRVDRRVLLSACQAEPG